MSMDELDEPLLCVYCCTIVQTFEEQDKHIGNCKRADFIVLFSEYGMKVIDSISNCILYD
jgi:hypothetical protein